MTANEALAQAAAHGDAGAVRHWLDMGASPKAKMSGMEVTALMLAVESGSEECVKELLRVSDARARDRLGKDCLMRAAYHGHMDCIRLLIPVSNLKARDWSGRTALMAAAWRGWEDCVSLLLPVSDLRIKSQAGETAADLARVGGASGERLASMMEAEQVRRTLARCLDGDQGIADNPFPEAGEAYARKRSLRV